MKGNIDISAHLKSLKLKSLSEYKDWCIQNNLSTNPNKNSIQQAEEVKIHARQIAASKLKNSRKNRKQNIISEYLDDYLNNKNLNKYELYGNLEKVHKILLTFQHPALPSYRSSVQERHLNNFCKLISHIVSETDCLFEILHSNKLFIDTIPAICQHTFIREIKDWKPKSHNSWNQFVSLVNHLFVKYEMPAFMNQAWFQQELYQKWFLHLATGQNIRIAEDFPELTKKQAHYFCQAPKNYSILGAIRYGQVLSFDGNERLANSLLPTRICHLENFCHEFWTSVIRWFIENPMLDLEHVGPIIDWLNDQKYVAYPEGIKQPNLSMKKRDPEATLRAVEEWHFQLGRSKKNGNLVWNPCGIKDFEFREGHPDSKSFKIWTIKELLSSKELQNEGRTMHHCASSYASSCNSGRSSIWSVELTEREGTQKKATLEIHLSNRQIVQARGRYNEKIGQQVRNIVSRWANQSNLSVGTYI